MNTALLIALAATVVVYTAGFVAISRDADRVALYAIGTALILVLVDLILGALFLLGVGA